MPLVVNGKRKLTEPDRPSQSHGVHHHDCGEETFRSSQMRSGGNESEVRKINAS